MQKGFWTPKPSYLHVFEHPVADLVSLCSYNNLHASEKAGFWSIDVGICAHPATSMSKPSFQSTFQFIPNVFNGVEVNVLCRTLL